MRNKTRTTALIAVVMTVGSVFGAAGARFAQPDACDLYQRAHDRAARVGSEWNSMAQASLELGLSHCPLDLR